MLVCSLFFMVSPNEGDIDKFKLRQLQSSYTKLFKNYYSKLCINKFIFLFYMLYICLWNLKVHSPLRLALQIPMTSSQKSTLLRSLCGVLLNLSKVGAAQALFLLLPQHKLNLVLCNRICAISKSQRPKGRGGGDKILI